MKTIKDYLEIANKKNLSPTDFLDVLFFDVEYENIDPSIFDDISSIEEIKIIFPSLPGKLQSVARKIWISHCQTSADYHDYDNTSGWNGVCGPIYLTKWREISKKDLLLAKTPPEVKQVYQDCPPLWNQLESDIRTKWRELIEQEISDAVTSEDAEKAYQDALGYEETAGEQMRYHFRKNLISLARDKEEPILLEEVNSDISESDCLRIFKNAQQYRTKKIALQKLVELSE